MSDVDAHIDERDILKRARKLVKDCGWAPGTEAFNQVVVLAVSGAVGPLPARIAKVTGFPRPFVDEVGQRARKAGIWKGRKLAVEWLDPENGYVAFVCDALTIEGLLDRSSA